MSTRKAFLSENNFANTRVCKVIVILILLFVVLVTGCESTVASTDDKGLDPERYASAEQLSCGARAGFLFGRLWGLSWSYDAAKELLPISENGTSLQAIQDGLVRHGIACEIRRMDPPQILHARIPMIVHLHPSSAGSKLGHFVLVTKADANGVAVIDPISGHSFDWHWPYFSDRWSGYALVRTAGFAPLDQVVAVVLLLHAVILLSYLCWNRTHRNFTLDHSGKHQPYFLNRAVQSIERPTRSLFMVMAILFSGLSSVEADELRSHKRDGRNAAILLAGLCGENVGELIARDTVSSGLPLTSLLDVQRHAANLSCPTQIRRLKYADLIDTIRPMVVLLRKGQDGNGQFCVVMSAGRDGVTLVTGGSILVQEVAVDEFRKCWTGHALVPIFKADKGKFVLSAIGGAFMAVLIRRFIAPPSRRSISHASAATVKEQYLCQVKRPDAS